MNIEIIYKKNIYLLERCHCYFCVKAKRNNLIGRHSLNPFPSLLAFAANQLKKNVRKYTLKFINDVDPNYSTINPLIKLLIMGDYYKLQKFHPGEGTWTTKCIFKEVDTLDKFLECNYVIKEYLIDNLPKELVEKWKDEFNSLIKKSKFVIKDAHYCTFRNEQIQFGKMFPIKTLKFKGGLINFLNRKNFCSTCHKSLYRIVTPSFKKKGKTFKRTKFLPDLNQTVEYFDRERAFRDKYMKYPSFTSVYSGTKKVGYFIFNRNVARFHRGCAPYQYSSGYNYKKIFKDFKENDPIWNERPWGEYCFPNWLNDEDEIKNFLSTNNYTISGEYLLVNPIIHPNFKKIIH